MLFIGAVSGAVGGWFAHRAFVVQAGAASGSSARRAVVTPPSDASAEQSVAANSSRAPSVQLTNVASGIPNSARSGEAPLYSAAKSAARASTSAVAESAQSTGPSSQAPTLDDLLASSNIRCTFGPGNGGSWPQGKLQVGDAAWQGGPVDFQSIDYASDAFIYFSASSPRPKVSDSDARFCKMSVFFGASASARFNSRSAADQFHS
jgi:hypothetical protein